MALNLYHAQPGYDFLEILKQCGSGSAGSWESADQDSLCLQTGILKKQRVSKNREIELVLNLSWYLTFTKLNQVLCFGSSVELDQLAPGRSADKNSPCLLTGILK